MWSAIGLAAAAAVAAIAWFRSARPHGYYDAGVYAMTARSHRRFAGLSLAFAAFFGLALGLHFDALGVSGLALYAIAAVWYGASFLRGASDDDV